MIDIFQFYAYYNRYTDKINALMGNSKASEHDRESLAGGKRYASLFEHILEQ